MPYRAGQHVLAQVTHRDGRSHVRAWSLSDYQEHPRGYRLSIKRGARAVDSYNTDAILRTGRLGLTITATTLVFAYPLSLVPRFGPRWLGRVIVLSAFLPFLTSVVVRSFAWIAILSREGALNGLLTGLGVIHEPLRRRARAWRRSSG